MATYIQKNNQQIGPLEDSQILTAIRAGTYSPEDLAWRDGMADWQTLRSLYPAAQFPPPFPPPVRPPQAQNIGDNPGMRLLLPVGRSGWAIAAGYLGLFSVVGCLAPVSVVISIIAILDIRKSKSSGHPKHGMGRAVFGLIMGTLGSIILLWVFLNRPWE